MPETCQLTQFAWAAPLASDPTSMLELALRDPRHSVASTQATTSTHLERTCRTHTRRPHTQRPRSCRSPTTAAATTPTSSSSASAPPAVSRRLALATYGVRVHAVTMFPWVANSPRAHITNQRAVEVLRDLGLEDDARKQATPWDQMGDTLFTTSLAGEEILRLQTWGTGDQRVRRLPQGQPVHDARPARSR